MRTALAALLAVALIAVHPVAAAPTVTLTSRVVTLEAQVADLQARVARLEAATSPQTSPLPSPTSPPAPTPTPQPQPSSTPSTPPSTPPQPTPSASSPVATPSAAPSRRFPIPTTTQTVVIPSTIDSTGATDVSAAVQTWVNSVPNGSILSFRPGTYRLTGNGITLDNRSNLILEGNGATLLTSGWAILDSGFILGWGAGNNSHITIQDFVVKGDNPDGATINAFHSGKESSEGLATYHVESYIEFANNTVTDTWGHGVYIGEQTNNADHVWVHDNTFARDGVMGVAIAKVVTAWVEGNTINDAAIYPIDFEDGQTGEPMQHVYVGHNSINRWGWNSYYTGHAIIGDGSTGMVWSDMVIDANTMTGGFQSVPQNGKGGLISFMGSDTKNGLVITNNAGPANNGTTVTLNNAPGAVVTGNTP